MYFIMRINTLRIRLILGVLGMILPIIVSILALIFNCIPGHYIPDSISQTYFFEPCITPFMIILGSASIVLICYMGYDKHDDIICTLAGIFGLLVCFFPCGSTHDLIIGTFQIHRDISMWIHNISAVGFFGLLSYNSLFLFTKGNLDSNPNKKKRNLIYRICGIGMLISLICIIPIAGLQIWGGIWVVETIALTFFGISWLTKSDIFPFLFCDTPYKD